MWARTWSKIVQDDAIIIPTSILSHITILLYPQFIISISWLFLESIIILLHQDRRHGTNRRSKTQKLVPIVCIEAFSVGHRRWREGGWRWRGGEINGVAGGGGGGRRLGWWRRRVVLRSFLGGSSSESSSTTAAAAARRSVAGHRHQIR
ncbi:hypothetical protein Vadar_027733 [Vaccinium darrowii]|uniref:Uncharacterized protein n=1 Tax=Vaccinium darrowii TaxID=229202 RepID=A0ACB7ZPF7_9ERIC|nr:hypothetical protein Vadar_027733 [Vaccinium darrowii]